VIFSFREGHKLEMFGNKILGRIFGPEKDEMG
jgi:hypothetical protein